MIYFISDTYLPNTAHINRLMSFSKAFKSLGIEHCLVFIFPSVYMNVIETDLGVNINYLWKNSILFSNNCLLRIKQSLWSRYLYKLSIRKFVRSLTEDDIVVYFRSRPNILELLRKKSRAKIFHEKTEHPKVSGDYKTDEEFIRYIEICKSISGILVISNSLKESFIEYGIPEDKIHVINMTVDTSRFENLSKNVDVERYIAYCGTVSNHKDGVDDLIRAFYLVSQKDEDIKLYIIGPCPIDKDSNANIELIEHLELKDRVILTGVIGSSEMPQVLKDAQVLVLARPDSLQARNGFPTKLGEYLLTENPVVITKTGDIPLFLKDRESALLAEPGDVNEISGKIIWALRHPEEAKIIGKNGCQVAIDNFNNIVEGEKMYKAISK